MNILVPFFMALVLKFVLATRSSWKAVTTGQVSSHLGKIYAEVSILREHASGATIMHNNTNNAPTLT